MTDYSPGSTAEEWKAVLENQYAVLEDIRYGDALAEVCPP
jgi:hypothetical protein